MEIAGKKLAEIFNELSVILKIGKSTLDIDNWIVQKLKEKNLVSRSKGYLGYKHSSCISINDEVVHGIPSKDRFLEKGDLVKVDICASWEGYCSDMARCYFVEAEGSEEAQRLVEVAYASLEKAIKEAVVGKKIGDISVAVQKEVEKNGFGVVRDFAGHGIGKSLHEDPEVLNYGTASTGPLLRAGMTLAIEPMITQGHYDVYVLEDGWTAKTVDGSLAAHVEDTILITEDGPKILTRI